MVCHVALQWSDRDKALIDGVVIGAGCGVVVEVFLADPEIRLPAGIDMFTDHRTSILDSLSRDANAFNLLAGILIFNRLPSGSPSANTFRTAITANCAASRKSKPSRATKLNASPGTPRIVASSAPATVPE